MDLQQCKHIRVRNADGYEMNVEKLVKSIESQYKIDFTSLKDWKKLLLSIENEKQGYESKIKSAIRRKTTIVDKIYLQNCRSSPFSLTKDLARTAHVWESMKLMHKKIKEIRKDEPSVSSYYASHETNEVSGEISDVKLTAHPNSEVVVSEEAQPKLITPPVDVEITSSLLHLPVNICTNQHKLISPLESQFSNLNKKQKESEEIKSVLEGQENYEILANQTKWIICKPSTIEVNTAVLEKQIVIFSLTNTSKEAMCIRFKNISDTYPFKRTSIYPQTPVKLCPGLSVLYKFVFKLTANMENKNLYLNFAIGQNVMSITPNEFFSVPVYLKSSELVSVISVTKTVNITPVYSWQIDVNSNFPIGILQISVDDHSYYMNIKKREIKVQDSEDNAMSVEVTGINTDSLELKVGDEHFELESKLLSHSKKGDLDEAEMAQDKGRRASEFMSITTFLSFIVEDIIDLALETFVFQKTFLYLHPNCTYRIPVLFSKAEHEGYHQCYYNLEFYDLQTDALVTTKIIKVFAEALPHPVQIRPILLDMTESPVNYGYREDRFVVTNTHKMYSVRLKIKMTKEMKRLFRIYPMKMTVPYNSSSPFLVRVCSKRHSGDKFEEFVHFTIKIIISGHESVFRNVPPFYYELILPCASEYNKNYENLKQ